MRHQREWMGNACLRGGLLRMVCKLKNCECSKLASFRKKFRGTHQLMEVGSVVNDVPLKGTRSNKCYFVSGVVILRRCSRDASNPPRIAGKRRVRGRHFDPQWLTSLAIVSLGCFLGPSSHEFTHHPGKSKDPQCAIAGL